MELVKTVSVLVCPYCNSTAFTLHSDGNSSCKACTLLVGYNSIEKRWGMILEEDGEPIFTNDNMRLNREIKLGLNLLYDDFLDEK